MALFAACNSNDVNQISNSEVCKTTKNNEEINSKEIKMKTHSLGLDSLTAVQKSCVEKVLKFDNSPDHDEKPYPSWDEKDYLTADEIDALAEISLWDYKKKHKSVDSAIFNKRLKDIFGYDFESLSKIVRSKNQSPITGEKYTDNLINLDLNDPWDKLYIFKKECVIINSSNFGINFLDYDDINSVIPNSRFDNGTIDLGHSNKSIQVSSIDYLFHLNNYIFNEANVSRTWLIINDKYFMSHLLIDFGYDGDNEINKMVLKKNKEEDKEIIDIPVIPYHIYPDRRVKILDELLKTAADLSTAECADYFEWASSTIYSFGKTDESNKHLSISQKREIIAHIVDHMQPVYEKYIEGNMKYGSQSLDLGDLRIIDCFWNYLMDDHEIIFEFEKNNYYGLINLESLILAMKEFKPFYNEESGEFEPWNYIPMRYRNSDEE